MELRQLRYLMAAAREGSFTRAAERLSVVQPAVSQQIRKLEAELGVEILHRSAGLQPTSVGQRILVRAERMLAEAAAVVDEANAELGLLTGRIQLGAMHWLGPIDLTAILARFLGRYPDVELVLREDTTASMLAAIRNDALDLTFASMDASHVVPGVELATLAEEEMVVVGTPSLLAEVPDPMPIGDLHEQPFVGFARGMAVRRLIEDAFEHADVRPKVLLESNELATVRGLAGHGVGLAILPRGVAEAPGSSIQMRTLGPEPLRRQLALGWRSGRRLPPAAAALRELALTFAMTEREPGHVAPR
jgi:DNA-binding transcriptional LysR family regulator